MTQIAEWGNLSPKLLRNLEKHYHNIETLYRDNMDIESIRENLKISYDDWLPMEDVIFASKAIYKTVNIFGETQFYMGYNKSGRSREIDNDGNFKEH